MATLTIELPDELIAELNNRQISDEFVHLLIVQTIEAWLRSAPGKTLEQETKDGSSSPFSASAIAFVEQLIDENRTLFERLSDL